MNSQLDGHNSFGTQRRMYRSRFLVSVIAILIAALISAIFEPSLAIASSRGQIEPRAGTWSTWVLKNGSQFRPSSPPDKQATKAEIQELRTLAKKRDQAALDRITYWNTGGPAYRWNEIALREAVDANNGSLFGGRALALVHAAIYDATIATWDAKYTYKRLRPNQIDRKLTTVISNPRSPSYPSEHAAAAGAASEVLAYLYPAKAQIFRDQAREAAESFLTAGVNYRSDIEAGLKLGRQVGELVVKRGQTDNSDAVWDGKMPDGPGYWTGQNPALPMAGTWKTWLLRDGSEFRPDAPFKYDSAELAAEMEELRAFQRTPRTNSLAFFWEYGAGGSRNFEFWNEILSRKILEFQLDGNAPRSARAFALVNIAYYDSVVACWDAKYTYWAIRPFQLDPNFRPLFTTPNHPSYPSAHSCLSNTAANVLAYLFPRDSQEFASLVAEIGESRIWAGLHFRSDIVAGETLAQKVADKAIQYAQNDGSQ